jgi:pyridoxine 5-phosphate synthase
MPNLVLGVNIDHVATLRQARRGMMPDPLEAALIAEESGADLITIHLREDRRHIQDHDVFRIKESIHVPLNLELAVCDEIIAIAHQIKPFKVTLVPERREEVTTEGGLNVSKMIEKLTAVCKSFTEDGILVSLFIEPDHRQIEASAEVGAPCIEIHTGAYSNASGEDQDHELDRIVEAVEFASGLGLRVHAGHGLTRDNVGPIAAIPGLEELNIGHSIISEAVLSGLPSSIKAMRETLLI